MNESKLIKSFTIKRLFGTTDLTIPFEDRVKILIGENGIGKTQVLNMVYYTLTKKFERLIDYVFHSIIVEFGDGKKIEILKNHIENFSFMGDSIVSEVVKNIGHERFLELRDYAIHSRLSKFELYESPLFQEIQKEFSISPTKFWGAVSAFEYKRHALFTAVIAEKWQEIIDKHLTDYQILYFPTYRLVEVGLHNLGYDEEKLSINQEDTRLIHFGMDDVSRRFNELTQSIERFSKNGLAEISGEILSQLVKGLPSIDKNFLDTINQQDIDIILARVGDRITVEDKKRIKTIVTTKEIQEKDYSMLYFLQKLINVYDQQKELDQSIKDFRNICNKYLVNKKIIYDESSIKIYVQPDGSTDELHLNKLSLGEKQIVSIFSKIYLSSSESKFIVLFDEPELSLSIFWQKELLPDIYDSGKCQFLLAVTHSPFIFDNNLEKYAIGLNEYFEPVKSH